MSSVPRNPDGRRRVLRMGRPAPRLMNARGCATTWTANAGRRPRWLLLLNSRLLSVASAKLPQPSLIPPADRTDPHCRLHREGRRRAGHPGRAVGQSRATEIIPRPFMCCVMTDGSTPQPRRRGFNHADDPSTGERRPPWTASWPAATRSSLSPGAINMTLEDRCRRATVGPLRGRASRRRVGRGCWGEHCCARSVSIRPWRRLRVISTPLS